MSSFIRDSDEKFCLAPALQSYERPYECDIVVRSIRRSDTQAWHQEERLIGGMALCHAWVASPERGMKEYCIPILWYDTAEWAALHHAATSGEWAALTDGVPDEFYIPVRNSNEPDGPRMYFEVREFEIFLGRIRNGKLDDPPAGFDAPHTLIPFRPYALKDNEFYTPRIEMGGEGDSSIMNYTCRFSQGADDRIIAFVT